MSEVTVVGLGAMGSALARTLLRNGYRVTVWNRTSVKAEVIVQAGAILAPSVAVVVDASPMIIVCVVDGYAATSSILEGKEIASALAGRVVVQPSTGSPQDARDSEAWAREQGVDYLDGVIPATPNQIGRSDTTIFTSGSKSAFQKSEPLLKTLAGGPQYMGESADSTSVWDLASISCLFGAMLDFFHGARIFELEGLRVEDLGSMFVDVAPVIGEMIKHEGQVIQTGNYGKLQSSLEVSADAIELIVKQAREAGINSEIPTFIWELFRKALSAGYGDEEVGALIKVLR